MGKKKRIKMEKETKRLVEGISHLVKKSTDGNRFKFKKHSKRDLKKLKKICPHWIIRNGEEHSALRIDRRDPPNVRRCGICGARFQIYPKTKNQYQHDFDIVLSDINQIEYYLVKLGGSAPDIKLITRLKEDIPRMLKVTQNIARITEKRNRNKMAAKGQGGNRGIEESFYGSGYNIR